jgi:hypothetical protein
MLDTMNKDRLGQRRTHLVSFGIDHDSVARISPLDDFTR